MTAEARGMRRQGVGGDNKCVVRVSTQCFRGSRKVEVNRPDRDSLSRLFSNLRYSTCALSVGKTGGYFLTVCRAK